ncbi:hypothetical protein D2E64_18130 [Mycobacteroides abscessus]|uniref:hypothetical protein n=1 Tax=Mycobacteroides abscessus TaxID=36809 RepID=UPI000D3E070F|nr:hypothetical protein [Mycobacteroides abscessus]PVA72274.1 hypothetical protein DDJ76_23015 [Mycobacteroides abscessus]RIS03946.1 hypothetical protein D2E63_22635 [Mycobacteroides abscessus]RIS11298.1 hypothetical protein D2E69_22175 [Mycobacteroides abscessus]RIS23598.1 hypothetical protein D2E67_22280 [Mycobacteroides abscessus]RIT10694.1 hypothetical protein D2E64_18130 [Mycobacteroides abscessus]
MGFKMNPNFEREIARELQKKLDKISDRYAGRPAAEVKAALKREGIDEAQADTLSAAISEGTKIKVRK